VSVTCPGIFEGNDPIKVSSEGAEIISKAFHLSTSKYFQKKHELKEHIRQSERDIDAAKRLIGQGEVKIKDGERLEVAGGEKKVLGRTTLEESKTIFMIVGGIIGAIFLICLIISIVLIYLNASAGGVIIVIQGVARTQMKNSGYRHIKANFDVLACLYPFDAYANEKSILSRY